LHAVTEQDLQNLDLQNLDLRSLVDLLAEHRTLGAAPRQELEWLAAHGTIRKLAAGEVVSVKGRPVDALYVLLSGRMALFVDRGAGPDKVIEWRAGDVSGLLPYSRLVAPPGDSKALEPSELLAIPREHLRELTSECFEITSILVHSMIDRARLFTSSDLQNEKMISLGKLSAGLTHELNNPASAIKRCAAILEERIRESEESARGLAAAPLSEAQIAAIDAFRASCMATQDHVERNPLEQSDREEAIAGWLAGRGLDSAIAEPLAETAVTFEALNQLAAAVDGQVLSALLGWLASGCAIRKMASRIQDSSAHISTLLSAVKGFTHMDQVNVAEPVDLASSLGDTVAVLKSKARQKSVTVTLALEADLPKVRGFGAELNQVWGNLIDNALDAAANGGKVEVLAGQNGQSHDSQSHDSQYVVVRIVDDGSGIADNLRDRVFDPFFTTKPMGQGIGLGLDIARRLVLHNDGAIDFESKPGCTEFRVRLPIADRKFTSASSI
jgi:signal transduction histidine kinase